MPRPISPASPAVPSVAFPAWWHLARSFVRGLLLLTAGLLGAAGLAQAATPYVTITAPATSPITQVFVGNELSLQVQQQSSTAYQAFPSNFAPGDYGTLAVIDGVLYAPDFDNHGNTATGFGRLGAYTPFTPVSQVGPTGTGTLADPFTVVTTVAAGSDIDIQQTISYAIGNNFFSTSTVLVNNGTEDKTVLFYRAMDCYLGGSDKGYSYAAPGLIACARNPNNAPADLVEGLSYTPGADVHYMEATYDTIWSTIKAQQPFPDTVNVNSVDNGVGISWSVVVPAGGALPLTTSSESMFSPAGVLPLQTSVSASPSSVAAGGQTTFTVTVTNLNGSNVQLATLTNILPSGFSYVSGSTAGDLSANPAVTGQNLDWDVSAVTVLANSSITFTFDADVAATESVGAYTDSVQGTAASTDYSIMPSSIDTTVVPAASALPLTTSVSVSPSTVQAGGQVTYTVTVANPNAVGVPLLTLTDVLPSGFSYVGGSTAGKLTVNPTVTGQNLQWNAASVTVPASGNITFTFRASVDASQAIGSYTTAVLGTATQYVVTRSSGVAAVAVVARAALPSAVPTLNDLALALLGLTLAGGAAWRLRRDMA